MQPAVIDTHQHLWNLEADSYPWIGPELGVLDRTFTAEELAPQMDDAGVVATVLVQAANSIEDTRSMLAVADAHPWVVGVVGWVPLADAGVTTAALDTVGAHPAFVGVRHLNHDEPDPDWLVRPEVIEGLQVLASRGVPFDVIATIPRHLELVDELARRVPELTMVVDHLAKPPIADDGWQPWADLLAAAAAHPRVHAKVSGLNTAADWGSWDADALAPYIAHAVEVFGPDRLVVGSDWPVAILTGDDYARVVTETVSALGDLDDDALAAVCHGTATRLYGLDLTLETT